ncbi:MAG: alpha/beta hydrolase [Proteobacteria bacterium]|nr:alpha/beta hydrolase [Pseudomonadota bacterium]
MRKSFNTSDDVTLKYIDEGEGDPVLLLHGWSQCAEEFKFQTGALKESFRILALDFRGHGHSEKPDHGYRVPRLARDLYEFLAHLGLEKVTLLGHSLGCSVIWSYLDQYGEDGLEKLILVDEPTCLVINPDWSTEMIAAMGAGFKPEDAYAVANQISGPEGEDFTRSMLSGMFTDGCDPTLKDWVIDCNLLFPRQHAATLLLDNVFSDWQDVISRIELPTLVIGGEASVTPASATRHIAEMIKGAKLEIFSASEGGSHFMFLENPDRFNEILKNFIRD